MKVLMVLIFASFGAGLFSLLCGLLRLPTLRTNKVMGKSGKKGKYDLKSLRTKVGLVFQYPENQLFETDVITDVSFGPKNQGLPTEEIRRNVPTILATVGLAGKYKAKIRELSGGEQQRVALARALINQPAILLADEPTGNLDPQNAWGIMELLEEINAQGTTVVMITHNREIVNSMHKRVIALKKGVIVSDQEEGEYVEED